jgi:hypothetical protein
MSSLLDKGGECPMEVTREIFRDTLHEPQKYLDEELDVAVKIVNWLRPFTPKRGGPEDKIIAHPLVLGPFCFLANNLLRAIGYKQFSRRLSPLSSCGKVQPLPLGATGICEVLCAREGGHYDVCKDGVIYSLTNSVSTPACKDVVFNAFFDMKKVEHILRSHNLVFQDR